MSSMGQLIVYFEVKIDKLGKQIECFSSKRSEGYLIVLSIYPLPFVLPYMRKENLVKDKCVRLEANEIRICFSSQ